MRPKSILSWAPVVGLLLLSACAPAGVAENFGSSQRTLVERQIQNPERAEVRNPVDGIGPATAADVVENYHKNQTTEAQQDRQERQRDNGLVDID